MMAKKSKMAPEAEVVSDAAAPAPEGAAVESSAPVAEAVPESVSKRASLTLKSALSGASFTFNVRPETRMKGGAVGPTLSVDGADVATKVSSNERLAAEGKTLWRVWLTLANGMFGYVITVPGETVDAFLATNGNAFVTESGRATRPDPKRELAKPIVRKPKAEAPAPVEGAADAMAESAAAVDAANEEAAAE